MIKRNTRPFWFLPSEGYVLRISGLIVFAALVIFPLFSVSSASLIRGASAKNTLKAVSAGVSGMSESFSSDLELPKVDPRDGYAPFAFLPQAAPPESVAIYQSDCSTPATDFVLGQSLCAKLTGAPVGSRATQVLRRLSIVGPNGYIRSEYDVSGASSTATLNFTIPSSATSSIGLDTIDNRGTWYATSTSTRDGSVRAKAGFQVSDSDTNNKVSDVSLQSSFSGSGEVASGQNVSFVLYVSNDGPDAAEGVSITNDSPDSTTFVSAATSDPNLTCSGVSAGGTGTITCSSSTALARGDAAKIELTFNVNNGTLDNTVITNVAEVTSTTTQRSTRNKITKAEAVVSSAAAAANCTLTCPADVVVTVPANSTGTTVNFSAAGGSGECGAVTNSPASGSFFSVGTHVITSSAEAGSSCTFTVKVLNTPAPTISCPANVVATAGNDGTATVNPGTPTFTPNDGVLTAVRSDAHAAIFDDVGNEISPAYNPTPTDPYPTGITGITWTVTDADGRTATCRQTVTVNGDCGTDTEAPTITAPDSITVFTGPDNTGCGVALDDELGQASAQDNCSVIITISGIPAGNLFPIGTTTLTYTATDPAGNTNATPATQTVTVVDNTPPKIKAPADASYVCASDVPAANANQATRGDVFDENGNLLPPGPPFDNCGVPTVAVTETRSGAGSASSPLIITRTFTATDSAATPNSASDVQVITVIDATPPTIGDPADVTAYTGAGATSCGTNVTLTAPAASDNCAADGVTVTRSPSGNTFAVGTTEVTWTATDAAGNTATSTQQVTVIDNTPPVITPPADITRYLPVNSTATSMAVSYPNPATATDNCSGAINISYSPTSGSVFSVGTTTVTISATDSHSNTSTATFTVTVLYNFTGFFSPVSNTVLNVVNAGRGVPVKFSLSGDKGLNIFAANSPYSVAINCDGSGEADVTETLTAGGSSLSYSPDQYNYVWKTENSWAGTCRQLRVVLNDGSVHTANFKFR